MADIVDTFDRENKPKNTFALEVLDELGNFVTRTVSHNSRVQAGGAALHAAIFGGTGIAFKYIALSNNASLAPANTDTTLSGEIVTSGLTRQAGTVTLGTSQASLNGTVTTTITASWSAGAAFTIYGGGAFSAISSGTLGFESTCTATPVSTGYTVNLTWTFNE